MNMRFVKQLMCLGAAILFANSPAWAEAQSAEDKAAAAGIGRVQPEAQADAAKSPEIKGNTEKILVTFNALPAVGDYEVIGPISVYKRWFGGIGTAMRLLGEKARELGANAVVESSVWLAPAFPAQVAPHGKGIAVRINDPKILQALADASSTWE